MTDTAKKWLLQLALSTLVSYNRFCIVTKIKYKNARKSNKMVDNVCNVIDRVIETVVASFVYLTHNKFNPFYPYWVSVCQYIPHYHNLPATTFDNYSRFFTNDLTTLDHSTPIDQYNFEKTYNEAIGRARWNYDEYIHAIVIGQMCPRITIVKLVKNEAECSRLNPENPHVYNPSSARFLEIEYKCGNTAPLTIEVPKSHYITGNELLSKTYILRYLEHLPIYVRWTFNETEYSLRVIDDNSDVFSIDSTQYILLEEDGYKIERSISKYE